VPQATDSDDGHDVARLRTALFQRVEGGNARAEDRCGLFRVELVRNRHQPGSAGQHHLGVSAVACGADEGLVLAELEAALTAWDAFVAVATESSYADALSHLPDRGRIGAQRGNASHDFMAGDSWGLHGLRPFDVADVRATDATGLDLDQHFPAPRHGRLALHQFQDAGLTDLHGTVGCFHRQGLVWIRDVTGVSARAASGCTPRRAASMAPAT